MGKHLNLMDNNSRTPLFLAAQNNHYESVRILLDNDASPFLKNIDGLTALDICKDIKIKKLIEEAEKVSI